MTPHDYLQPLSMGCSISCCFSYLDEYNVPDPAVRHQRSPRQATIQQQQPSSSHHQPFQRFSPATPKNRYQDTQLQDLSIPRPPVVVLGGPKIRSPMQIRSLLSPSYHRAQVQAQSQSHHQLQAQARAQIHAKLPPYVHGKTIKDPINGTATTTQKHETRTQEFRAKLLHRAREEHRLKKNRSSAIRAVSILGLDRGRRGSGRDRCGARFRGGISCRRGGRERDPKGRVGDWILDGGGCGCVGFGSGDGNGNGNDNGNGNGNGKGVKEGSVGGTTLGANSEGSGSENAEWIYVKGIEKVKMLTKLTPWGREW